MTAKVAITRCATYDPEPLKDAVRTALSLIGSLREVVKPSQRVMLKINHLGHHRPESAVQTRAEFARAVIELVQEITDDIVVADGLGTPGIDGFATSGILQVCRDLGVELLNFKGHPYREVDDPAFEAVGPVPFPEAALDADVIITLPKLKTHVLCLLTGAVKNSYGFVPTRLRSNYHLTFPEPDAFSNAVVDVFQACRPHLAIVDGVVALEGTGPSSAGVPKPLGVVLAGRDCVAVDAVVAAIMGLAPTDVASTRHASRRGIGEADLDHIEVLGEPIGAAVNPFALPSNRMLLDSVLSRLPGPVARMLIGFIRSGREYPQVIKKRCVSCGLCVKHCPAGAVTLAGGTAKIDPALCIACFCCQEFCEHGAIGVRRQGLGALLALAAKMRTLLRRLLRRN